jgi:adenylate cyclase
MAEMQPKLKNFFPISRKLAIMTIGLLLTAAIPIAVRTSSLFKEVSGKREEESNRSQANSRAAELNGALESYVDKIAVIGVLKIQESVNKPADPAKAPSQLILQRDKDIVRFTVYTKGASGRSELVTRYADDRYLKGYKSTVGYLDELDLARPFPVEGLYAGQPILKNRSQPSSPPIVTLGVPVVRDARGIVTHVAIADLPLALLQRGFSKATERTVYLVDKEGQVLAHPQEKLVLSGANLGHLPIVKAALNSKVSQGQLKYQNPKKKSESFIAAYAKTIFDLSVISEAPESVILEPALLVQKQVYYIAGIVVSISFFVVMFFAMTLTKPIETLVAFAGQVAVGNFDLLATSRVKSKDEVEMLAWAFDGMTSGLRERDKVKNLMNKFHGSAVTDDLLAGDQVGLGGTKKQVAVFFSDIRGFTAFSEKKTPEQVVSMLNEYFQEMVRVINARGGVVDKFIGDAIMAVWGAPKSTGNDAVQAVTACIEMRLALDELNKRRQARGDIPIKIGMGLHYGEAISGTIGSDDRMEYTVIGDTVNMASRIEASTKAFGTDLLLSDDIAKQIESHFILELAGSAEVKGKSEPLKFFKVRGYIDPNTNEKITVATPWSDYEAEKSEKVHVV